MGDRCSLRIPSGFDGLVVHGRADRPVCLWVHDGNAEPLDAAHQWGRFTADVEDTIRDELGDRRVRFIQCGPVAEKGVRFAALVHDANRAGGPTWQLYALRHMVDVVRAVTGWNVSLWELTKVGELRLNLLRAFNAAAGWGTRWTRWRPSCWRPCRVGPATGWHLSHVFRHELSQKDRPEGEGMPVDL